MKYIVEAHECNMQLEIDSLKNNHLLGSWVDSLLWFPTDSCYAGARPIERITHIDFYSNGRYKFMETYPDTTKNYLEEGEYWTYYKNDTGAVVLAEWYGDKPIQPGDTIIVHEWLVHSLTETKLRMRSGYHQNMNPNVHEFRKVR